MNDANARIVEVSGSAIALRGNDIDTDRIMPARFLREITFEGLGEHVFADDRVQEKRAGRTHPFDDPKLAKSKILFVEKNFGCGSSREHAPQGLRRWGIRAIVAESFGEIFAGNCISVGVPCVRTSAETMAALRQLQQEKPERTFVLNLRDRTIAAGNHRFPVEINEGPRTQFVEGSWDATRVLLAAGDAIERVARALPYLAAAGRPSSARG
jgi:3-isopropylmalate/(R)-2-methylmalate dehydratase small subunit